jgi:hypothetical protein
MNNEPVAWTGQNTFCKYCHRIPSQCSCTHPAKTLTDEEIDYEFDEFVWTGSRRADFELIVRQVEKAILRKAQEK